jgi:hypothetical protein
MTVSNPLSQRELVTLQLREEGKTYKEIAEAIGMSVGGAKSSYDRAVRKIAFEKKYRPIMDLWHEATESQHLFFSWYRLELLAQVVREKEREACAKIAANRMLDDKNENMKKGYFLAQQSIAKDIRARGQK